MSDWFSGISDAVGTGLSNFWDSATSVFGGDDPVASCSMPTIPGDAFNCVVKSKDLSVNYSCSFQDNKFACSTTSYDGLAANSLSGVYSGEKLEDMLTPYHSGLGSYLAKNELHAGSVTSAKFGTSFTVSKDLDTNPHVKVDQLSISTDNVLKDGYYGIGNVSGAAYKKVGSWFSSDTKESSISTAGSLETPKDEGESFGFLSHPWESAKNGWNAVKTSFSEGSFAPLTNYLGFGADEKDSENSIAVNSKPSDAKSNVGVLSSFGGLVGSTVRLVTAPLSYGYELVKSFVSDPADKFHFPSLIGGSRSKDSPTEASKDDEPADVQPVASHSIPSPLPSNTDAAPISFAPSVQQIYAPRTESSFVDEPPKAKPQSVESTKVRAQKKDDEPAVPLTQTRPAPSSVSPESPAGTSQVSSSFGLVGSNAGDGGVGKQLANAFGGSGLLSH